MKRFFVSTLTMMFLTCMFLTNVLADYSSIGEYGYAPPPFDSVYGYSYVTLWYDADASIAYSSHNFFVSNGGNVPIRYYYLFECSMEGIMDFPPQDKDDEGWVNINKVADDDEVFQYDMANSPAGRYDLRGSTQVSIKADFDNNGNFDAFHNWDAPTTIRIILDF